MAAYAVGFYDIRDASWRDEYREGTMALVEKHGGRFLVRPDCAWEVLEESPPRPTGMVIIEFPSMDTARSIVEECTKADEVEKYRMPGKKVCRVFSPESRPSNGRCSHRSFPHRLYPLLSNPSSTWKPCQQCRLLESQVVSVLVPDPRSHAKRWGDWNHFRDEIFFQLP